MTVTDVLLALISVTFFADSLLQARAISQLKEEAQLRDDSIRALSRTVYDLQRQLERKKRREAQP